MYRNSIYCLRSAIYQVDDSMHSVYCMRSAIYQVDDSTTEDLKEIKSQIIRALANVELS